MKKILVINSGSSSIKYRVFSMPSEQSLLKGLVEHIGEEGSGIADHFSGLKTILKGLPPVDAVGHRVVHGGENFKKPVVIDNQAIKKIRQCSSIAPLHNPANLAGIIACRKLLPGIKQTAVFDTAFHQTLPDYAYMYGLPYEYYRKLGIRKYGFHGTSHAFVSAEAARLLKRKPAELKLITCHLGNGCSIAAIDGGKAVDTSMGFTPLEGLIMGTRCGDLDPALVTYLMRKKGLSGQEIDDVLNKESGLKGISGISNDMRVLEKEKASGNRRAGLALEMFVYRIKKYIGAYIAVLGGCDAVVFTAGVGENQKNIREAVCRGTFDAMRRKPKILVVPTNEELMIARQAYRLVT
jgi:acetate kinase